MPKYWKITFLIKKESLMLKKKKRIFDAQEESNHLPYT